MEEIAMTNAFIAPLSVYFIWHPADETKVKPIFNYSYSQLSRDVNRPFSRSMNLPVFIRTSSNNTLPDPIQVQSHRTIAFIFLSFEVASDDQWVEYIEGCVNLPDSVYLIPIALDKDALGLNDVFSGRNFIRSYDFDSQFFNDYIFIAIAHEIYRYALNESFSKMALGVDTALKLFLSHSKNEKHGVGLAHELKNFIDHSLMRNFFDASDIAPGFRFSEEIEGHIKGSTVIAIHTDSYSSRYWCQREIMFAKENDRPIIAVDCLEEFEDRRFPFATNIPGVHMHLDGLLTKQDLLRILSAALLETIRFFYSKMLLTEFKRVGWIQRESMLLARPPELSDISRLLDQETKSIHKDKMIIYPEPPVYMDEITLLKQLDIKIETPLTIDLSSISGLDIGISISDPSEEEIVHIGQAGQKLVQLSQDLARHLLKRGAVLHYGGDLRKDGFTEFIFHEALALQARTLDQNIHLENHIAWPLYLSDTDKVKHWKADIRTVAKMNEYPPHPDTLKFIPNVNQFLSPSSAENQYVWSRSLSEMRRKMIRLCDARISAGGRQFGYKGIMPGVLEEIMIALELKRPLFLLGGFGGMTANVCNLIESGVVPDELTESWQIENNGGYDELLNKTEEMDSDYRPNYKILVEKLCNANLRNGLSDEENIKLFHTPFIEEALYLIFKGLKSCVMK